MKPNELFSSAGETYEYARIYLEQQVDYLRLETAKRIAKTTSSLLTAGVISILALMAIIFLSIALGFFLGDLTGSNALAFLIVGFLYIIIITFVFIFKKTIITNPILSMVIKEMLD